MHSDQTIRKDHSSLPVLILVSCLFGQPAYADNSHHLPGLRVIQWGEISAESLASIPIKATDHNVLLHEYEKRGFVAVPLDYSNPAGRQIHIFYRLMPSNGSATSESGRHILVIMNGGPGTPSIAVAGIVEVWRAAVEAALAFADEIEKIR